MATTGSVFQEDKKYYPQVYLYKCVYGYLVSHKEYA